MNDTPIKQPQKNQDEISPCAVTTSATVKTTTAVENEFSKGYQYNAETACSIEKKWQARWLEQGTFSTPNPGQDGYEFFEKRSSSKRYILDMFPYPSGEGLHVGHPIGYIATDIYARYLRAKGYHVLHTMGFDAFGLPAEQYAVEHGVHPRITTERNIGKIIEQLHRLGIGHDTTRRVATIEPNYYKWTQWIFLQIYNSWYDEERESARPISELISEFESGFRVPEVVGCEAKGGICVWSELDEGARREVIDSYRLVYLAEVPVNWCPGLGTVLANEEVTAEGRSERGNFQVYKRPLKQWMMRISKYSERLLYDLKYLDWPEPINIMQRNWIGRSEGAYVDFLALKPGADTDKVGDEWFAARKVNGWVAGQPDEEEAIRVFTTRPDTLFGATYMVLAPEHPLVDKLKADKWPDDHDGSGNKGCGFPEQWKGCFATKPEGDNVTPREMVAAYRMYAQSKSDVERQVVTKDKTGVFIGCYALNPVNKQRVPVFIADYVLMVYGTGAIMAVPAHDTRDYEFAQQFDIPVIQVVQPDDAGVDWRGFVGDDGVGVNSCNDEVSLDGVAVPEAKKIISQWLVDCGLGETAINYKLRDWLFSRQRYWGEPFPVVYDEDGVAYALEEKDLPVVLPELEDFTPASSDDPEALPEPPLARADEWVNIEIGGKRFTRETNTMPQWAGSCWYYLRYLDPANRERMTGKDVERYWMLTDKGGNTSGSSKSDAVKFDESKHNWGGVDLYVGGAEHAVLHLLYARFWHKVLYDLGYVSTPEPFQKLFNQGYVQAYAYTDKRGVYVNANEVEEGAGDDGKFYYKGAEVTRTYGKMGKSLKNMVTPDEVCGQYGCDTLRLYEMYLGPLEQSKPWSTRDIVGSQRFLQRIWRNLINEDTGELKVTTEGDKEPQAGAVVVDEAIIKLMHKTIDKVDRDMNRLAFNTAIAALIEFNKALGQLDSIPRYMAEVLVKMLAPFVPHIAEELWERLGNTNEGNTAYENSVTYAPFPVADPAYLHDDEVQLVVQVMGKVRAKLMVAADTDEEGAKAAALADEKVAKYLEGKTIRKVIYVPGRLINFVAN